MAFAITANFLLGTYQGSDSGGRPEPYPSPDRLYKACVAAAYNTFDFERQTDDRVLTDEQIKNALAWLEDNPPHSILLPRVIPPTSDAISYRDKGYLEKGKVKKSPDKASKAMSYCQNAVESLLLTWQWDENPNQEVINTLNLLCGEVPYLGEACSVVELKVIAGGGIPEVQRDKTWTLEKGPMLSGISRHNRVFAVPGTGRLEELKRAYMAANPEGKGKGKNAAKSKIRAKEAEQNFLNQGTRESRYWETVDAVADQSSNFRILAPASALVQRAGRVNRRGLNPQGDMYVFGVEGKRLTAKTAAPYDERDLDKALAWLEKLPRTDSELPNMSAWSVRQSILQGNYVPAEKPRRLLFQRLEPWDAENLSSTDEQLSADLRLPGLQQGSADLNLWLRDDLADDSPDIGVVVRDLPQDTNVAIALLEETEPENEELFPLRNQDQAAKLKASLEGGAIRAFLYRASNEEGQRVLPLGAADANRPDSYDGRIKTGDVIVLDASVKMFTELSSEGEVVMLDLDGKSMAKDVYNACALGKMVRYYKEADGHDGIKTAFTQAYALVNNIGDFTAEQQEQMNRDLQLICTPASEMSSDSFADANTLVLNRIMYEEDETGCKTWWVVVSLHASDSGSESDQEILSAKAKEYELLLGGPHRQEEGHQDHVAARAEALARMVGFDDDMVENLRIAGEYHDEGKIDARFQTLLYQGRKPQGQRKFRAKSRFSSRAWEQQFRNQCQLRGWRHEQRSVAEFVLACETETELRQLPEYRRQLIERLIGTSHGHGRSTFEHGTDYLLPESGGASRAQAPALNNIADDLFESGGWEALIDRTNQRYGFWGVSYMEALLRAADITCSKEGL